MDYSNLRTGFFPYLALLKALKGNRAVKHPTLHVLHKGENLICVEVGLLRNCGCNVLWRNQLLHLLFVNRPRSDSELPRLNSDLGAREDKYPRSEFSLGNSASDLGLWFVVHPLVADEFLAANEILRLKETSDLQTKIK
ncbi:hypothetical protein OUZ56_018487 [Daphnia magna]|uniref:Uncharacterized protein n=1 Tax=Daphnia magna TaxID=35525 RepID=A0ABQ9ZA42_9CRUS|nr:hypothetical protein OUZ56_018487 [Daphnia magna]